MVKLSAPLALLAIAVASAVAQNDNNNGGNGNNQPAPSGGQGQGQGQNPSPSPSPTQNSGGGSGARPTSESQPGGGEEGGASSPVCSALFGDPKVHNLGECKEKSTTVPPYNLSSLVNYMVGGFSHNRRDPAKVVDVASDLADSVVKYYPTVTQSWDVIRYSMYNGLLRSIYEHHDKDFEPTERLNRPPGAEPGDSALKNVIMPGTIGVAAAVIGGAIFL